MTDNANLIQGSPEWHEARMGKITGTGFHKVLSKKGNTRKHYMRELILERKTGISTESFTNAEMEWGTQNEPMAREYYEKVNYGRVKIKQVGFINYQPESQAERVEFAEYVGVSPDGLVETLEADDGVIEIKCPNTSTHLGYMASRILPSKYKSQVQGILWVTKRKWCDFISFDPRVEKQPFCCINVKRDEEYINNLKQEVSKFIDEMVKMQNEIKDVDPQLLIDVTGGCSEEEWLESRQMEIRGKVRHGVVCAIISTGNFEDLNKDFINKWVDFIVTGE